MAPGISCNNTPVIGAFVSDKIQYQKQFRFSISMENEPCQGYVTEKLTEAFVARTVPIYLGDPDVSNDFDNESFVNFPSTDDYVSAIEHIISMDNNTALYLKTINNQVYTNDTLPDYAQEENTMSFFERIFG